MGLKGSRSFLLLIVFLSLGNHCYRGLGGASATSIIDRKDKSGAMALLRIASPATMSLKVESFSGIMLVVVGGSYKQIAKFPTAVFRSRQFALQLNILIALCSPIMGIIGPVRPTIVASALMASVR